MQSHAPVQTRRRGASVPELLIALLVLSFVIAGTARLLVAGERQQSLGRNYSQVQTDLRLALNRATRAIRHAHGAQAGSSDTQLIVEVPQASGETPQTTKATYYRSGDTFFMRPSTPSNADPVPLITGVDMLSINYFRTDGAVRTPVDVTATNPPNPANPTRATEVRIAITARRGRAAFSVDTLVAMRNAGPEF